MARKQPSTTLLLLDTCREIYQLGVTSFAEFLHEQIHKTGDRALLEALNSAMDGYFVSKVKDEQYMIHVLPDAQARFRDHTQTLKDIVKGA